MSAPDKTETAHPTVPVSHKIVAALICDLAGRNGLGDEWLMLETDVHDEVWETWVKIVERHLKERA